MIFRTLSQFPYHKERKKKKKKNKIKYQDKSFEIIICNGHFQVLTLLYSKQNINKILFTIAHTLFLHVLFYNFFTNSSQILQVLTQPFHVPTQRVNPVPTQKKVAQTKPSKQSLCLDQNPNQMTLLPFVLPTLLLKPLPKCRATQQIVCQSEKHLTQVEFRPKLS